MMKTEYLKIDVKVDSELFGVLNYMSSQNGKSHRKEK